MVDIIHTVAYAWGMNAVGRTCAIDNEPTRGREGVKGIGNLDPETRSSIEPHRVSLGEVR